jgi:Flp pilus assembly protein TadB
MPIVVNELPIEDAVERARQRLARADRRLADALAVERRGLPWLGLGVPALAASILVLTGMVPVPGWVPDVALVLLASGAALLGYGVPLWYRNHSETQQRMREWQHALRILRLREQQAEEEPALSVEVLDRIDAREPLVDPKWKQNACGVTRYVQ